MCASCVLPSVASLTGRSVVTTAVLVLHMVMELQLWSFKFYDFNMSHICDLSDQRKTVC